MANIEAGSFNQKKYEILCDVHRQSLAQVENDPQFSAEVKKRLQNRLRQNFLLMAAQISGHQNECLKINDGQVVLPNGSVCPTSEAIEMGYRPVSL